MIKTTSKGLLALLIFTYLACDNNNLDNNIDNNLSENYSKVETIKTSILWRTDSYADSNQNMVIKDGVIYFAEKRNGGAVAIDVETGKIIWRDKERAILISKPLFFENELLGYIAENDSYTDFQLYLYSKDGAYIKKIICPGEIYAHQGYNGAVHKNKIYWNSSYSGLMEMDIEKDVKYENSEYIGYPKTIYQWIDETESENPDGVRYRVPLIYENILYTGYHSDLISNNSGIVISIDLTNYRTIWEVTPNKMLVFSETPLYLKNNKLMVLDGLGFGSINALNGEIIFENSGYDKPGSNSGLYWIDDDYVYFTNYNSPTWDEDNIFCLNINTGEVIWKQSRDSSHGSNPVTHNGILYIAMQGSIDLYSQETGEYLGSDQRIRGDEWQLCNVLKHENIMIFRNLKEVIAIKMDFKLDTDGKLWQKK